MSFKDIKLFLLDMDGTVYIKDSIIKGAIEGIEYLKKMGIRVAFLTNNSSKSTQSIKNKLNKLNISVDTEDIVSSTHAAAYYLNKYHKGEKVFIIGTDEVADELIKGGILYDSDNPDIVLLTFDTTLCYDKLDKAVRFIKDGAYYVATHPDLYCPYQPYDLIDVGIFIKMLHSVTGRNPDMICGKPYKMMAEYVQEKYTLDNNKIAIVGDRLYTDILFGINNNYKSCLVLTGETTEKMLNDSDIKPDITLKSLIDIKNYL